jgi:hypothetical protein
MDLTSGDGVERLVGGRREGGHNGLAGCRDGNRSRDGHRLEGHVGGMHTEAFGAGHDGRGRGGVAEGVGGRDKRGIAGDQRGDELVSGVANDRAGGDREQTQGLRVGRRGEITFLDDDLVREAGGGFCIGGKLKRFHANFLLVSCFWVELGSRVELRHRLR